MAKKNFATAPKPVKQPTDGQIAAYERGGTGHDTPNRSTSTPATTPKAKTEPTKRLSLDLPLSLHTRFKTACSATRSNMAGEIQAFIKTRTAILEKEAGIDATDRIRASRTCRYRAGPVPGGRPTTEAAGGGRPRDLGALSALA